MDNPDSEMVFYLMLRAVDRFYQQHSRYPGMTKAEIKKKDLVAYLRELVWYKVSME